VLLLCLQFALHVMVFHMLNVLCTFTLVHYYYYYFKFSHVSRWCILSPDLNSRSKRFTPALYELLFYLKNQMLYQLYATKIVTTSLHFQLLIILFYICISVYNHTQHTFVIMYCLATSGS
jgi:hypothetical protein